jgi:hypothetical protein
VQFFKRKRDYEEDKAEEIDLTHVTDLTIHRHNSLKHVADTVSIDGDDYLDTSSQDSIEGIEEIDSSQSIQKSEYDDSEMNKKLDAHLKDTVSRDSSLYQPSEDRVSGGSENIENNLGASIVSESESEECKSSKNYFDQFDIIMSKVKDYSPQENELDQKVDEDRNQPENEIKESEVKNNSDEKEEMVSEQNDAQPEVVEQEVAHSQEEQELLELNSSLNESKSQNEEILVKPEVSQPEVVEEVKKEVDEEEEEEDKDQLEQSEEFKEEPRLSVSVSVVKADIIKDNSKKRITLLNRAIENFNFVFQSPEKKIEIAQIEEIEGEKSKDHVITCKPGQKAKRRWRIINNSSIRWPKNTVLLCQDKAAEVEIPVIKSPLLPGNKLDISINIKINEKEKHNVVKVFVFRFHSKTFGYFGEPLTCTVEVTPEVDNVPQINQEEQLSQLLDGDEFNTALYEIANDFVEEGLGNFEQCLDSLLQCKANYEDAKKKLQEDNK